MNGSQWDRRFWFFFSALLAFRCITPFILPLDLSPDEAYYWEWSRRLAWGYYSKPPLVAWIIWLFSKTVGDCTGCIRLAAATLSSVATLFTYMLTRRLSSPKTAFLAALLSAVIPASAVLSLVITIDAPLMAFWTIGLYSCWRAVEQKGGATWWLLTGIVVGFAMLAKQTAVIFWPLAFLFLVLNPSQWKRLLSPWPFLGAILSFCMLIPTLLWNMDHHWITLRHTEHHFKGLEGMGVFSLEGLGDFILSQAGILSPFIWLVAWTAMIMYMVNWRKTGARERFLLTFSLFPLAGVILLSLLQKINANWPAPFYAAAMPLAALLLAQNNEWLSLPKWLAWIKKPEFVVGSGLLFTLLLYLAGFAGPLLPVDPAYRLRGWKETAAQLHELLRERGDLSHHYFIMTRKRQTASELAFYLPHRPIVYRWPGTTGKIKSQYELWPPPADKLGWDVIFVMKDRVTPPPELKEYCTELMGLQMLEIKLSPNNSRRFSIFLCRGLKGWPGVDTGAGVSGSSVE